MKFNFKIQQYQTDAVDAVVKVFNGQGFHDKISYIRDKGKVKKEYGIDGEVISQGNQMSFQTVGTQLEYDDIDELSDTGYKNELVELSDEQLLSNIQALQRQNNIKLSNSLVKDMGRCSLDIEMETGTGKTYVYIKTMFELNKKYGWSKFIVVVPSIAIREGVKKSFEITADHFMEHYGKKARFFIYNSSNLNQLDNFSSSSGINVMIINTQAFASSLKEDGRSKEARIIYSKRDEFGSRRPIDVIKANRPIIILDEPQKMGGEVTQKALKNFNPLFSLNYSATHAKHHKYDLIGKVAEGTTLTRKTVSAILQEIRADKLYMFKNNPEEFITKVIRLINEQKATMIVEHISYDTIEGEYDSTIFTAEKNTQSFDKAFLAKKAIQDYVFTDGSAEQSIERRFAEDLDAAEEVCVYAKLPRTFQIPTPVGNYSPDWAIAFYEGTVKHIFFVAETKGTMETLNLRPIEQAKISCAKKLFNEMSNSKVVYHDVDSYQSLLNIMNSI